MPCKASRGARAACNQLRISPADSKPVQAALHGHHHRLPHHGPLEAHQHGVLWKNWSPNLWRATRTLWANASLTTGTPAGAWRQVLHRASWWPLTCGTSHPTSSLMPAHPSHPLASLLLATRTLFCVPLAHECPRTVLSPSGTGNSECFFLS